MVEKVFLRIGKEQEALLCPSLSSLLIVYRTSTDFSHTQPWLALECVALSASPTYPAPELLHWNIVIGRHLLTDYPIPSGLLSW